MERHNYHPAIPSSVLHTCTTLGLERLSFSIAACPIPPINVWEKGHLLQEAILRFSLAFLTHSSFPSRPHGLLPALCSLHSPCALSPGELLSTWSSYLFTSLSILLACLCLEVKDPLFAISVSRCFPAEEGWVDAEG